MQTNIQWEKTDLFGGQAMNTIPEFDIDLSNAILLFLRGELTAPSEDMPDWQFNALAFAQANDIGQFINTTEYETAIIVGAVPGLEWFHFF